LPWIDFRFNNLSEGITSLSHPFCVPLFMNMCNVDVVILEDQSTFCTNKI